MIRSNLRVRRPPNAWSTGVVGLGARRESGLLQAVCIGRLGVLERFCIMFGWYLQCFFWFTRRETGESDTHKIWVWG